MALSKHPFGRYQIIDRELIQNEWVKTKELARIIEYELGTSVSVEMLRIDIRSMSGDKALGYFAPISYNRSKKAWFYTDENYTIKAFGLREDDINALRFYASTINQYKEYDVFRDFSSAIEKVLAATDIQKGMNKSKDVRDIVQVEKAPQLVGSDLIPEIIRALNENRKIKFQYQKFDDEDIRTVEFEPYLLKEYNHRWYLLGKKNQKSTPTWIYGLDRIKELEILASIFEPEIFDFELYFQHSIGITVESGEPIEITLSFTPKQGKYLKALKFHKTQVVKVDSESEFIISITLKPNWEFYEKILGYGANVKVIAPDVISRKINEIANEIVSLYK